MSHLEEAGLEGKFAGKNFLLSSVPYCFQLPRTAFDSSSSCQLPGIAIDVRLAVGLEAMAAV